MLLVPTSLDRSSIRSACQKILKIYRSYLTSKPRKIGIKLNLCSFKLPETGAVSHPLVVEELVEVLKTVYPSADIYLMEADTSTADAELLFKYLGFETLTRYDNVQCVNISKEHKFEKTIDGYILKKINIPCCLEDMDLFISHPKLKSHSLTKISCGLKNQFGCLPTRDRACYHKVIDEIIADVNLAYRPHLTIVDGILAHTESTPLVGVPIRLDILLASHDIVAVDSASSRILGLDPYYIGHIRKASGKKLGNMQFEAYGAELDPLKMAMRGSSFDVFLSQWIWHNWLRGMSLKA